MKNSTADAFTDKDDRITKKWLSNLKEITMEAEKLGVYRKGVA
jgi:hypothetical protein